MPQSKSSSTRLLYGLAGLVVLSAWMGVPAAPTVPLIVGLAIRSKNPRRGLHLIIAGAMEAALWFWMLPLYAPFMIALIALAISLTPREDALAPAI